MLRYIETSGRGSWLTLVAQARVDFPMLRYLESLRSWQLLLLAGALLLADLLVPDPIPFLDELLLGVITYSLARWKKPPP